MKSDRQKTKRRTTALLAASVLALSMLSACNSQQTTEASKQNLPADRARDTEEQELNYRAKPSSPEPKNETSTAVSPQTEVAKQPTTQQKELTNIAKPGRIAQEQRQSSDFADTIPKDRSEANTEEYDRLDEHPFKLAKHSPLSTFAIDVDTASYSNVRRFLSNNQLPPQDAVRIEELINYFPYEYPQPKGNIPFAIATELSQAPWNSEHQLVRVGIQGKKISTEDLPPSNLVFLLDVSGSMNNPDKLPLLKSAFRLLVDELRPEDRVAIVVYAGAAGVVLPSTPGDRKDVILDAIERLNAGGSTAGGEGIKLAYKIARDNFLKSGNNRIILATDGDFNVGISSDAELVSLIEGKRKQDVFLTVLGFGTGNLKDTKMEQIANKGNGNYAYIDSIAEAKKVLVREIGATLLTIAKDVKIQVEFNPTKVKAYRLIGYENRALLDRDFSDDTKDAGELGAGHSVTALYEVIPVGAKTPVDLPREDSLRYQTPQINAQAINSKELMLVKLRYKRPDADTSQLLTQPILATPNNLSATSTDFRFAAAVAEFGMILRDSPYKGNASLERVIEEAQRAKGSDLDGYRAEFIRLVEVSQKLASF